MSYSIYGNATMRNGVSFRWLRFVEAETVEAAKKEAVRIMHGQHANTLSECKPD